MDEATNWRLSRRFLSAIPRIDELSFLLFAATWGDADGIHQTFQNLAIILNIVLRLWKTGQFLCMFLEVLHVLFVFFDQKFDGIESLRLDLEWVVDFKFAE